MPQENKKQMPRIKCSHTNRTSNPIQAQIVQVPRPRTRPHRGIFFNATVGLSHVWLVHNQKKSQVIIILLGRALHYVGH